jgi:hypothetical protein
MPRVIRKSSWLRPLPNRTIPFHNIDSGVWASPAASARGRPGWS